MRVIKKIFKVLGIILLVLLGIIILGLLTTTIIHRVNLKRNKDFLAEQGLYQPVSVGDHSLNLVLSAAIPAACFRAEAGESGLLSGACRIRRQRRCQGRHDRFICCGGLPQGTAKCRR